MMAVATREQPLDYRQRDGKVAESLSEIDLDRLDFVRVDIDQMQ
jgi:hypothetical protein